MKTEAIDNPWVFCARPNPRADMRLFGFPYAGGGAAIFRRWHLALPESVEVCGIQLPGRGSRLKEAPLRRAEPLLETLAAVLLPFLDRPFAFFGHSLGAMVAFELAHRLREQHKLTLAHLFVGGRRAPQVPRSKRLTFDLPHDEFVAELRRLNGTPREVLEHPEMMELMLPILRADFEISETYEYVERPPLPVPLSAFGGLQDEDVPLKELELWSEQTGSTFLARMLPGDHFFLHSSEQLLLPIIRSELEDALSG